MNDKDLINIAIEARKKALSPTKYYVGVAFVTKSGKIYSGCNIGFDNELFNICAEKVAIVKMLSENPEEIEKLVVVGGTLNKLSKTLPCGSCRQFLADINFNGEIICAYYVDDELKIDKYHISDLLPETFKVEK